MPAASVVVEGSTDLKFINCVVRQKLSDKRIVVVSAEGDLKRRVRDFDAMIGGLASSPYKDRLFVVFDKVRNRDQEEEVAKMGASRDNIVVWSKNGIEYLYPLDAVSAAFGVSVSHHDQLVQNGDRFEVHGVVRTKTELNDLVCYSLGMDSDFPEEFQAKFLNQLLRNL
jgi:hypothetical protein